MPTSETRRDLTALEWSAALAAAVGAAFCLQFPFVMGPPLAQMLAEFGSDLPTITQLGLTRWFPLVLGLIPASVLVAVVGATSPVTRRGLIAGAFALSLVSSGICLYAMYAPMLSIAGSIK